MITTLIDIQKDIAHITGSLHVSKSGIKLDKEVCYALLSDLLKLLDCIFLDIFTIKLFKHSLD